jgi:hypothetical protein
MQHAKGFGHTVGDMTLKASTLHIHSAGAQAGATDAAGFTGLIATQ